MEKRTPSNPFQGTDQGSLPLMFLFAEISNGNGVREAGRETDYLTDDHNSDTD